jgi:hypothetical protein
MNAWLEYARWWLHGRAFTSVFEPIFYAVVVILIFVVVMGIQGCTDPARQIQARAADSVAQAANSALPILIERYRQDGFRALDKLKAAGGTADDVPATLDAVRAKWKPVWDAWKALVVAQDAWADALEGGGNPTAAVTALKDAYCGLRGVWPEDIPAVPLAPVKCPE